MARKSNKKERLVSAAAGLFWRHGYDGTSIKDIALEASVPKGNVYYYFPDKAQLAMAVAQVFSDETASMLEELEVAGADPRNRLLQLFERLATSDESRMRHGCPIALAARDFRRPAPAAASKAGEAFSLLIVWIARQRQAVGQRPSIALSEARRAIVDWQGAITLAHALQDPAVLTEAHRRIRYHLTGTNKLG